MDVDEQEALGEWDSGESDAGQFAHAAVRPVTSNEPADPALVTVREADRDTVRILFRRRHFAAPDDLAAQFGDAPVKLGFNLGLGDHQTWPGHQRGALADGHAGREPAVDVHDDPLNLQRAFRQAVQRPRRCSTSIPRGCRPSARDVPAGPTALSTTPAATPLASSPHASVSPG